MTLFANKQNCPVLAVSTKKILRTFKNSLLIGFVVFNK